MYWDIGALVHSPYMASNGSLFCPLGTPIFVETSSKLQLCRNFVETSSKLCRAGELIPQGIYYKKIRGYAYMSLTEKYIIYEDNSETRFYIQNIYFTCKLHIKLTCSWKPWNDHTVITVILPPALWSKYRKMKSLYIRPYNK